jgi:hypothetical protein
MRDQHRPKQDLINEVIALRKQVADLREAMTPGEGWKMPCANRRSRSGLVDAAPVGLCLFRPNGTPLAANRPFARLLGYDSTAELLRVADTLGIFGSREEQGRVVALVERGLERVAGVVFRRKDGSRQAFGVIGSVSTDPQVVGARGARAPAAAVALGAAGRAQSGVVGAGEQDGMRRTIGRTGDWAATRRQGDRAIE